MTINYSIIIPYKDGFDLLKRMVASIPYRKDLEIIIVDDDSAMPLNAEDLADVTKNVFQVHRVTQSKGAGNARNVGMSYATGNYLLFADSDDYYHTDRLNELLDECKDYDYDVIYYRVSTDVFTFAIPKWNRSIDCYIQSGKKENAIRFSSWNPWNKMVSHKFVNENQIEFECVPKGNDFYFSEKVGLLAKRFLCVDKCIYHYCKNPNGITFNKRKISFEEEIERLKRGIKTRKFLYKHKVYIPIIDPRDLWRILIRYGLLNLLNYMYYLVKFLTNKNVRYEF